MKLTVIAAAAVGLCFGTTTAMAAGALDGPVNDAPISEKWAPSKFWGAGDRAGSANHMKNSANIKRALKTIKQYKAISVGKYYHREAPAFGPRIWHMVIPGTPTGGPFGKNALVYHDEVITTQIGQIQTQFDGPGHIGVNTSNGMFFYNGVDPMKSYERGAVWWCSMRLPTRSRSARSRPARKCCPSHRDPRTWPVSSPPPTSRAS